MKEAVLAEQMTDAGKRQKCARDPSTNLRGLDRSEDARRAIA
jgi:hypothetical protein